MWRAPKAGLRGRLSFAGLRRDHQACQSGATLDPSGNHAVELVVLSTAGVLAWNGSSVFTRSTKASAACSDMVVLALPGRPASQQERSARNRCGPRRRPAR